MSRRGRVTRCHLTPLCSRLSSTMPSSRLPSLAIFPILLLFLAFFLDAVSAIKFNLPAYRYPPSKCIWNAAHANSLVIVTANVGPGANQRVDIEIIDSGPNRNIYLSKRGIKAETRLAITTHSEGEVGVCLKNYIEGSECPFTSLRTHSL